MSASRIDEPYLDSPPCQLFSHALVNFPSGGSLKTRRVTVEVMTDNFLGVYRLTERDEHRHLRDLSPGGDAAEMAALFPFFCETGNTNLTLHGFGVLGLALRSVIGTNAVRRGPVYQHVVTFPQQDGTTHFIWGHRRSRPYLGVIGVVEQTNTISEVDRAPKGDGQTSQGLLPVDDRIASVEYGGWFHSARPVNNLSLESTPGRTFSLEDLG